MVVLQLVKLAEAECRNCHRPIALWTTGFVNDEGTWTHEGVEGNGAQFCVREPVAEPTPSTVILKA